MKALWLTLALLACTAGFAWLALAMPAHWQQVCGARAQSARAVTVLRVLGAVGIAGSLLLCLRADHASMAALVWVLLLAAASMVVAFTLAWRPRWLRPLAAFAGGLLPREDRLMNGAP